MTRPDPFDAPGLPPLPRTCFEFGRAVPGIEPRNGWAIHYESGHHRTGYEPNEYVAVHENGAHAVLQHCRWRFNPTQERWDWLVDHKFNLPVVVNGTLLPFTDWHVDTAIEEGIHEHRS